MARRGQPVAGVVTDAADDGCALTHGSGDLPAGRLHEPVDRDAEPLLAERVDLLDLRASESG